MSSISEISIKNLDHLGIVAGLIDEIGIVELLDKKMGIDTREKITAGTVVKAILLNGLGFVSRPLYLFNQFFEDKSVEKLLGKEVKADYLNDDKIGRVMDELYKYGLNSLFIEIIISVIKKFKIETKYLHLDSTSFHVDGEYKSEREKEKEEEIIKERPIIISKGYSRDHRPDLKQCVLDLITTEDGELPLFVRVGDGNEADKAVFGKILVEFKKQLDCEGIVVADSALYSQENLQLIRHLKWISRVPMTIKKAKDKVQNVELPEMDEENNHQKTESKSSGYSWKKEEVTYGGIKQIWLIIASEKRRKSDEEQLDKKLKKEFKQLEKQFKKLAKEEFERPEEARYQLNALERKIQFYEVSELEISEIQAKNQPTIYKISGVIREKTEAIAKRKKAAGRFILATNVVDQDELKPEEILATYKNQQMSEKGFRFLKDPLFFVDSFFVESPQRVETMLFLMSICLLVYNLGQRELRNSLKRAKVGVKNQVGKITNSPTLRWVFQCFQGIHILTLDGEFQVVNLTEERSFTLKFLPSSCQKYYLLS
jgi:transposase